MKKNKRTFAASRFTSEKMLKKVLQTEGKWYPKETWNIGNEEKQQK